VSENPFNELNRYESNYLVMHLVEANQFATLNQLLKIETRDRHNAWYEAKEALGDLEGYLADINQAWRIAERHYNATSSVCSGESIALQCRYALIQVSLKSLAANIPPNLLALLVAEGIWTPTRGLAYSRAIPDSAQQVEALTSLAPYLPEALLQEALHILFEIDDLVTRADALSRIAPHLTEEMLREALVVTLGIEDKKMQAAALVGFVPRLAELGCSAEALETIDAMGGEEYSRMREVGQHPKLGRDLKYSRILAIEDCRSQALDNLIPHLPDGFVQDALSIALKITNEYYRIKSLSGIIPRLQSPQQNQVLYDALTLARGIGEWYYRAQALVLLTPYLPKAEGIKVLREAGILNYSWGRADVLSGVAVQMAKSGYYDEALTTVHSIRASWIIAALESRINFMDQLLHPDIILEPKLQIRALTELIPYLAEKDLFEAWMAIWLTEERMARVRGLVAISIRWAELGHPRIALFVARIIRHRLARADALSKIAPHLTATKRSGVLMEALSLSRTIGDHSTLVKGRKLLWSGPRKRSTELVTPTVQSTAMIYPLELDAQGEKNPPTLNTTKKEVLQKRLAIIREVKGEWERAKLLAELIPDAPEPLLHEVLSMVDTIQDGTTRTVAMRALAPRLSEELLRKAVASSRRLLGDLQTLPLAVQGHQRIVELSARFPNQRSRAEVLKVLIPYLTRPLLREVEEISQEIRDATVQSEVSAAVATRLMELGSIEEALVVIWTINIQGTRSELLRLLAPRLIELSSESLYILWQKTLLALASRSREDFLLDLRSLDPVVIALGGQSTVLELTRSIREIGRWWP
jgi:hypothetical protein